MKAGTYKPVPAFRPMLRNALHRLGRAREWPGFLWRSDFRKRWVSWTRFRAKRLSVSGFLSFDRGTRLRICLYLAIAALYLGTTASLPGLVRVACRAIEEAGLPSNVCWTARFEKAMQVHALQVSLIHRYDVSKDGRIGRSEEKSLESQTGLSAGDLTASCTKGDFEKLLAAAQTTHVMPGRITREVKNAYTLPPGVLAHQLMRLNFDKGMRVYRQLHDQLWKDAEPYLTYTWAQPKDYLKWETWKRGAGRFYDTGKDFLREGLAYARHPRVLYDSIRGWIEEYQKQA